MDTDQDWSLCHRLPSPFIASGLSGVGHRPFIGYPDSAPGRYPPPRINLFGIGRTTRTVSRVMVLIGTATVSWFLARNQFLVS